VVADEPVSALDMTVQKQILKLIRELQERYGFACLFVSHDLGAVEQVADRVAVMQHGKIVEVGDRDDIFDRPQHEYTRRLLDAAMLLDRKFDGARA
jgi:peptide/nickel transport system ATP-binding protein